ncbi:MAG: prephenate dehydrogenase/arogenate dehydrogenase family protein [Syntrophobacteraceae bacterium]|nr:prephenate dehydrogenase/arogenate dehydrogenase family protein [Desulfobacteraceae bacterium]
MEDAGFTATRENGAVPFRWGPGSRLGVIGGLGEMGRLFGRFFGGHGYKIAVADPKNGLSGREVVEESDMVLFAVPLHRTEAIIRELVPCMRPGQLLMDLTSLKTGPVREMLQSPAFVVGLHPMFGGRVSTFSGQTLAACPVRIGREDWASLRALFTQSGIRVKETTPEAHDRMMSIIQVLFHMTTMLKGRVLREIGVDIAETMEYTSPSYRLEINLLGRMFAQSAELYSAITQMNPYTGEILDHLRKGLDDYGQWVAAGDLQSFAGDFDRSAEHLGEFCASAYQESSNILDYTVDLFRGNGGR